MKITKLLIAGVFVPLFLLTNQGGVFFAIGAGLLLLTVTYFNYLVFGNRFIYWILPIVFYLGAIMSFFFIGRELIRYAAMGFITIFVVILYVFQEKCKDERMDSILKDISRTFHYIAATLLFIGFCGLVFQGVPYLKDEEVGTSYIEIVTWSVRLLFFLLIWGLNMSYFRILFKNNTASGRVRLFRLMSGVVALIITEVFWFTYYLPLRYLVAGVALFLVYFIFMEFGRYVFDKKMGLRVPLLNAIFSSLGLIAILLTAKWGS